ncbi:unnamed protein product, partial [Polarella glacialis]
MNSSAGQREDGSEDEDEEELQHLAKEGGLEIFRELLRYWPRAHPEDYFKQGSWQKEIMLVDIALLKAHRGEAGSLETLLPRSQVCCPPLPSEQLLGGLSGIRRAAQTFAPGVPVASGMSVANFASSLSSLLQAKGPGVSTAAPPWHKPGPKPPNAAPPASLLQK